MAKYTLLKNKTNGERSIYISSTGEKVFENIDPIRYNDLRKKALTNSANSARNSVYSSLGLTKCKVNGRTFWE